MQKRILLQNEEVEEGGFTGEVMGWIRKTFEDLANLALGQEVEEGEEGDSGKAGNAMKRMKTIEMVEGIDYECLSPTKSH